MVVQNGVVSIRKVTIGASNLKDVEIIEGLKANEQVIVKRLIYLKIIKQLVFR